MTFPKVQQSIQLKSKFYYPHLFPIGNHWFSQLPVSDNVQPQQPGDSVLGRTAVGMLDADGGRS